MARMPEPQHAEGPTRLLSEGSNGAGASNVAASKAVEWAAKRRAKIEAAQAKKEQEKMGKVTEEHTFRPEIKRSAVQQRAPHGSNHQSTSGTRVISQNSSGRRGGSSSRRSMVPTSERQQNEEAHEVAKAAQSSAQVAHASRIAHAANVARLAQATYDESARSTPQSLNREPTECELPLLSSTSMVAYGQESDEQDFAATQVSEMPLSPGAVVWPPPAVAAASASCREVAPASGRDLGASWGFATVSDRGHAGRLGETEPTCSNDVELQCTVQTVESMGALIQFEVDASENGDGCGTDIGQTPAAAGSLYLSPPRLRAGATSSAANSTPPLSPNFGVAAASWSWWDIAADAEELAAPHAFDSRVAPQHPTAVSHSPPPFTARPAVRDPPRGPNPGITPTTRAMVPLAASPRTRPANSLVMVPWREAPLRREEVVELPTSPQSLSLPCRETLGVGAAAVASATNDAASMPMPWTREIFPREDRVPLEALNCSESLAACNNQAPFGMAQQWVLETMRKETTIATTSLSEPDAEPARSEEAYCGESPEICQMLNDYEAFSDRMLAARERETAQHRAHRARVDLIEQKCQELERQLQEAKQSEISLRDELLGYPSSQETEETCHAHEVVWDASGRTSLVNDSSDCDVTNAAKQWSTHRGAARQSFPLAGEVSAHTAAYDASGLFGLPGNVIQQGHDASARNARTRSGGPSHLLAPVAEEEERSSCASSPWTPDTRLSRTMHLETSLVLQEDMLIPAPVREDESEDLPPECPELPNDNNQEVDYARVEAPVPTDGYALDAAAPRFYEEMEIRQDGHVGSEGATSSEPLSRCSLGAKGSEEIQKLHIMCQSLHEKPAGTVPEPELQHLDLLVSRLSHLIERGRTSPSLREQAGDEDPRESIAESPRAGGG